jgi:AcrR family transcriptional regulator
METRSVASVSERDGRRADVIVEAAGRLFLAPGLARVSMDELARELGMSKKTIYRHFPDKRSLLTAVLDRQFAAVERTLVESADSAEGQPFHVRVQRFLIAAGTELDGHRQGLLSTPPELLSEITRGALERLLTSQLPHELDWTAADLLRATVDTVLHGAIRTARPGTDDDQRGAVIPTARNEERERS